MDVNRAALDALLTQWNMQFNGALGKAPTRLADIASVVPSNTRQQTFQIAALLVTIRQWVGDRVVQNLGRYLKTLENLPFEGTFGVDRDDIEDDNTGGYDLAVQQLASLVDLYPYERVINAIDVDGMGSTVLGFDGMPFFSTTHTWPRSEYTTSQANKTTLNLDADAVKAGITAMAAYKGPDGQPLNVRPNVFLCAGDLEFTAKKLFIAGRQADSDNHELVGQFSDANIIVEPRLTAQHWFLLDCTKPVKPLLWQSRRAPQFVAMDELTDESAFMRKQFRYGVDFRGIAGALAWWLAYGSDGSEAD